MVGPWGAEVAVVGTARSLAPLHPFLLGRTWGSVSASETLTLRVLSLSPAPSEPFTIQFSVHHSSLGPLGAGHHPCPSSPRVQPCPCCHPGHRTAQAASTVPVASGGFGGWGAGWGCPPPWSRCPVWQPQQMEAAAWALGAGRQHQGAQGSSAKLREGLALALVAVEGQREAPAGGGWGGSPWALCGVAQSRLQGCPLGSPWVSCLSAGTAPARRPWEEVASRQPRSPHFSLCGPGSDASSAGRLGAPGQGWQRLPLLVLLVTAAVARLLVREG